jgi:hypothetical protein
LNLTFFAGVGPLGVGQKADVNGFLCDSGSSESLPLSSVACCSASEDDDVSTIFLHEQFCLLLLVPYVLPYLSASVGPKPPT